MGASIAQSGGRLLRSRPASVRDTERLVSKRERRLTKRERKAATGAASPEFQARLRAFANEQGKPLRLDQHTGSGPKMSEVLLEWAAPLLEPFAQREIEVYRKALTFAALIWNEATDSDEPADVIAEKVMTVAIAAGGSPSQSMRALVARLIEDRRDLHGSDRRLILETEAHDKANRRQVTVAVLPRTAT
jgi:hypothetical protein